MLLFNHLHVYNWYKAYLLIIEFAKKNCFFINRICTSECIVLWGPSIRKRKLYLLHCNVHRIDIPYSSTVGCERVFFAKFISDEQVLLRCTYINYNTSKCTHGLSIFLGWWGKDVILWVSKVLDRLKNHTFLHMNVKDMMLRRKDILIL